MKATLLMSLYLIIVPIKIRNNFLFKFFRSCNIIQEKLQNKPMLQERGVFMEVSLTGGYVTDYDDFYLWVESFEEDADASVIAKDENGEAVTVTKARVGMVVSHSEYDSEDDYDAAVDDLLSEDYDTFAEFVTDDGIYYIGVEHLDEGQRVESFEIEDDVYYC
jgi:hypothetical protein